MSPTLPERSVSRRRRSRGAAADGAGRHRGVREPTADRRKTLVRVTPKGYELCHQCEQALRDYFASVLARLEPEQVAQISRCAARADGCHSAENAAQH